jgi:hypothetical protein
MMRPNIVAIFIKYSSDVRTAVRVIATLLLVLLLVRPAAAFDLVVTRAHPDPTLTALFIRHHGWTGADGAHSWDLGSGRSLWLFGDTFIGTVTHGRRTHADMLHCTAGWLTARSMRYFWRPHASLLPPAPNPHEYYWPNDGAMVDGKLWLFLMRVRPSKANSLGFDWVGNDLVSVPGVNDFQAPPTHWHTQHEPPAPLWGSGAACLVRDGMLYSYGSIALAGLGAVGLERRQRDGHWQLWARDPSTGSARWADSGDAVPLFPAPSEFSVTRVRGVPGWIATYMQGLTDRIWLRWAPRPEGPWSEPVLAYRCPDARPGIYLYSARAHPELTRRRGELVITYCRNAAKFDDLMRHADIYRPQVVRVQLRLP